MRNSNDAVLFKNFIGADGAIMIYQLNQAISDTFDISMTIAAKVSKYARDRKDLFVDCITIKAYLVYMKNLKVEVSSLDIELAQLEHDNYMLESGLTSNGYDYFN